MNLPNEINNLKRPPQSGEAELSLLGALLIDNNAWESIADIVTENDFYNLENKLIFKSINDLLVKNKHPDLSRTALWLLHEKSNDWWRQ